MKEKVPEVVYVRPVLEGDRKHTEEKLDDCTHVVCSTDGRPFAAFGSVEVAFSVLRKEGFAPEHAH